MAAVLRVKRRNAEEPLEALVIACKRRKTENIDGADIAASDPVTAVLKFAGTVKNQADNVIECISKTLTKEELKANFKNHVVANVTSKTREQSKQKSQENRYKVVNYFRSLESNDVEELVDKEISVIDVEDSTSAISEETVVIAQDENYVYDLYYTQTGHDMLIDQLVSIHPFQDELVFGSYRDNGIDAEVYDQSEDSNSESNWRNDYPDSDHSENSICEDDMRSAVKRISLRGDSDVSSVDEDFVYALPEDDVDHFGFEYAKYKARINAEMDNDLADAVSGSDSGSEDDEYRQYEDPS
ncbi:probable RNA polymerase II nuclear localization protein SLC7A6OS [Neodiprion pinetum]|uniref:Probable RNA polymerase II nuclear localization protein SLC7A6OS n=1 Tax=Neodiprion lecontei TaxID=441921 RepID=A0A6J0C2F6_NEOLC|nr:probable RNA polymerase II nuclear localization protein SLC7A6OS [Neodiprion lecontei]XP_046483727.1 probable RNA polymerase II nuclear localization protein SLC7A6OS [Neodiprion pinetum]XP_046483728.1 probable RNA polymerase II nuclear localization protein SLC7A6OS [Neodiprion pinetum]XP_046597970.1 probable RNA polymerase II nuclear localization protein SLC7A6OS [Neodiprion lecontei]